jgi:pSer/pThr/pTyr-binding forkhead associated (FHA) protein
MSNIFGYLVCSKSKNDLESSDNSMVRLQDNDLYTSDHRHRYNTGRFDRFYVNRYHSGIYDNCISASWIHTSQI